MSTSPELRRGSREKEFTPPPPPPIMRIDSRYLLAVLVGITTILAFPKPQFHADHSELPATPMASSSDKRDSSSAKALYVITTKDGTTRDQFNSEVKGFDNGVGLESVHDAVDYQVYTTHLTESQAAEMEKIDCVRYVWKEMDEDDDNDDSDEDRATPLYEQTEHKLERRARIVRRNSPTQLTLLSWNKPGVPESDDYIADSTLGKGTTIYIIDTGFNLNVPDLANTADRQVHYYVVDNEKTLPLGRSLSNPAWRKPQDMTDWSDHGTGVACVAGGLVYGVASKANLFLVKAKNAWQKPGEPLEISKYRLAALSEATMVVLGHIRTYTRGKAVVNLSLGKPASRKATQLFDDFIARLEQLDTGTVTSAGNTGTTPGSGLEQRTPTNLGTDSDSLVTVGGVKDNGNLWRLTVPERPNQAGSMSVYAQAEDVETINAYGAEADVSGTSYAAATISGLMAYFLGHKDSPRYLRPGFVAIDLKGLVTRLSTAISSGRGIQSGQRAVSRMQRLST
ncbi:uncharacterized protein N7459_008321 [Penicillium hispanicum]|uniref:uncharacterized protein n=1 Tax=Penicillium hispanicum TaxID=1080232 RepID=UPI0025411C65|nr:uncharacterized protein N7459_008321 [Penicillium hispanicum]KAJ5573894.1 hypothetical protein N7459_008321 [Penicillium hispanicum]